MDSSQDPLELAKHGRALRALAQGVLRDEHAADDAVQEALLQVVRDGAPRETLFQRLRGLVLRHARDRKRSEAARQFRESRHATQRRQSSSQVERSFQSAETVTRALAALPEASREVLWLRFYEDLGPREIADRLALPLETVRARLRRALAALRTDVEARLQSEGRTLRALLPLAGLAPSSAAPLATVAGSAGGFLLMKKLVLVAVAILGCLVWMKTRRDPVDLEPLDPSLTAAISPTEVEPELQAVGADLSLPVLESPLTSVRREQSLPVEPAATPVQERVQLRVTVRDQAAGQLVPFFDLQARFGDTTEKLRTDREGALQFEVPAGQPVEFFWGNGIQLSRLGSHELEFVGSVFPEDFVQLGGVKEALTSTFSHHWEGRAEGDSTSEVELLASVGPTWFVDVQTRPGVAPPLLFGLKAKLRYAESLLSPAPEQVLAYDDVLWVRFPELPVWKTQEGQDLLLILQDEDGLFRGAATVSRKSGFNPHPLPVLLERCSAFVGTVSDDSGTVVQGVTVRAQAPGEERTFRTGSKADGRYRIQSLEPKLWTLYVSDPRFEPFERAVTLRPGMEEVHDISLVRKRGGGRIAGTITSQSGIFEGWVFFFLEGLDGTTFWRRTDPAMEDTSAGKVAHFEFTDVPPGRYRLIANTNEPYRIPDRVRTVEAPAEDLSFVVLDEAEPRRLTVVATGAESGEAIDHKLRIIVDGSYADTIEGTVLEPASDLVAPGCDFTWTVTSPGRIPVTGTQADLTGDEIRVALRSGFGAWLHLIDVESLNDLAGVEIFADGVSLGRTNERGELFASWDERPERIHFDENEWLIHNSVTYSSEIDPETGALRSEDGQPSVHAYLRRVR